MVLDSLHYNEYLTFIYYDALKCKKYSLSLLIVHFTLCK